MEDPVLHEVLHAHLTVQTVATIFAHMCQQNKDETGEAFPLELPVELRARLMLAVDAVSDCADEANRCMSILTEGIT